MDKRLGPWTKSGLFLIYFISLQVEGCREVRGEEGEGLKGMTYSTKPTDQELPLSPLSLYLAS